MVEIVAAHAPFNDAPLVLRAGDAVHVGKRNAEWPLWLWCENGAGAGWVPEGYLEAGVAKRRYSSREIAVAPGDYVDELERYGGWVFVRTANGEEGWILERCLESAR